MINLNFLSKFLLPQTEKIYILQKVSILLCLIWLFGSFLLYLAFPKNQIIVSKISPFLLIALVIIYIIIFLLEIKKIIAKLYIKYILNFKDNWNQAIYLPIIYFIVSTIAKSLAEREIHSLIHIDSSSLENFTNLLSIIFFLYICLLIFTYIVFFIFVLRILIYTILVMIFIFRIPFGIFWLPISNWARELIKRFLFGESNTKISLLYKDLLLYITKQQNSAIISPIFILLSVRESSINFYLKNARKIFFNSSIKPISSAIIIILLSYITNFTSYNYSIINTYYSVLTKSLIWMEYRSESLCRNVDMNYKVAYLKGKMISVAVPTDNIIGYTFEVKECVVE